MASTALPESTSSAERKAGAREPTKVKVRSKRHVRSGQTIAIRGRARPAARRWVTVRVAGRKLKTVRTRADGRFRVRWRAPRAGVFKARAIARGTKHVKPGRSGKAQLNVYRAAEASWYGPGFYGNRTACGKTLTTSTLGVANKHLPCGTKVTLRYRGRTARVRVIDRGPYAGNREYDLTGATKAKLGFGSTGVVLSTR